MKPNLETATLAGGCFWCLEAVFDELKGVESVESGISGREQPHRDVCTGMTGHAEVIQVQFDPAVLRTAICRGFVIHDPTTPTDRGATWEPYRSAIFFTVMIRG
jgi:peptide-methionine (S)-S-oxide reductase